MKPILSSQLFFLIFLLCISLPPSVSALGMAPGKTILDFTPNKAITKEILLVNDEQTPLTLALEATGELADYITLSQTRVTLNAGASVTIPYTVTLPQQFPHSGNFEGMIIAHQASAALPGEKDTINIGAVVGVGSTVQVKVSYQGKALLASLTILPTAPYKPVEFLAQAQNAGDEELDTVYITALIYNLQQQQLAEISSEQQTLQMRQRANFVATWDAQVSYGEYHAVITFFYDGQRQQVPVDFVIGHFPLELLDLRVEDFIADEQALFVTTLANTLDEAVPIISKITLERDQQPALSLPEQAATLQPRGTVDLKHLWQLSQIPYGTYQGTLTLTFGDSIARRPFLVELSSTGISASLLPFNSLTGATVTLQPDSNEISPSSPWLMWVILLLLAHLLFFVFYLRKRQQEKEIL